MPLPLLIYDLMKWHQKHKTAATILGILLLPLLFSIYLVDRFLVVFLCWMNGPTIIEYFTDPRLIAWAFARVLTLLILVGILCLIF
jgi:hypothetical protein